jgi:hypothetical protein
VNGNEVYGVYIGGGVGYRSDSTINIATHGAPEGVYMVASSLIVNGGCCFDFGNAEWNNVDNGDGHMDAISLICATNPCNNNAETGLDMENGIYGFIPVSMVNPFVTVMGWNDGQHNFATYQGNANSGGLTTSGSTPLPSGYAPMYQEGAIILGIGGDNSDADTGIFYEGVMTAGTPTSAALSAIQANVVSAGYSLWNNATPALPAN